MSLITVTQEGSSIDWINHVTRLHGKEVLTVAPYLSSPKAIMCQSYAVKSSHKLDSLLEGTLSLRHRRGVIKRRIGWLLLDVRYVAIRGFIKVINC